MNHHTSVACRNKCLFLVHITCQVRSWVWRRSSDPHSFSGIQVVGDDGATISELYHLEQIASLVADAGRGTWSTKLRLFFTRECKSTCVTSAQCGPSLVAVFQKLMCDSYELSMQKHLEELLRSRYQTCFKIEKCRFPSPHPTTLESGSLRYSWEICLLESVAQLVLITNRKLLWTRSVFEVEERQRLALRI